MPQQASQQGPHSLGEAFKDFSRLYPREIVYPIFRLLERVALYFPILESQEAIDAFVWIVGRLQTQTVAKEQAAVTARNRSPKRLQTPVLRALRHTRDFYFKDVRQNFNDDVMQRIPRWGKEVQTLPVYKGKIDTPHPVTLAWEYDSIRRACDLIKKEVGFSGWTKFAEQIRDGLGGQVVFPLWPKGTTIAVDVPEIATAVEAALTFLGARTGLSGERLRKLIQEGNRFFPEQATMMLQERWEKAYINPKLGILRAVRLPEENATEFDIEEALEFGGFEMEWLFPVPWPTVK
jgi:hypothetical protein